MFPFFSQWPSCVARMKAGCWLFHFPALGWLGHKKHLNILFLLHNLVHTAYTYMGVSINEGIHLKLIVSHEKSLENGWFRVITGLPPILRRNLWKPPCWGNLQMVHGRCCWPCRTVQLRLLEYVIRTEFPWARMPEDGAIFVRVVQGSCLVKKTMWFHHVSSLGTTVWIWDFDRFWWFWLCKNLAEMSCVFWGEV